MSGLTRLLTYSQRGTRRAQSSYFIGGGWLGKAIAQVVVLSLFAVSLISAHGGRPALAEGCLRTEDSPCPANPKIDIAVMLDRSGSLDPSERGLAFNIQVEGLARALRDPSVIPRDGSVAILVGTFTEQATLRLPLTEIQSAAVAEMLATEVDKLTCPGVEPCPVRGSNPGTNFGAAIRFASLHLGQSRAEERRNARRVIVLSTDGECTDAKCGRDAADEFRLSAAREGAELDVVLIGNSGPDKVDNEMNADELVFPPPIDELPGATLTIEPNSCTDGVGTCDPESREEQVEAFAGNLRSVLRSHLKSIELEVTSTSDGPPGSSASDGLTLRQAIDEANARGGETRITFKLSSEQSSVITLNASLPPICAPGITIEGCPPPPKPPADQTPQCSPSITIDGANRFCDGLLIRSNRAQILGLRIRNFTRAGITVAPLSPLDNVGSNRIEGNSFDNNSQAGVLVLDPDSAKAVLHNERNTIVGNTISGSLTPIDLGGDGRTANDDGDADAGPNTLLNFPEIDSVEGSPSKAVIKGTLCGRDPSGQPVDCRDKLPARIDVFAVTEFKAPSTAKTVVANEDSPSDQRLITSVRFIGQTSVKPDSSFEIEVGASPTCGYVVTATDREGNTSEVSFPCNGFGKVSFISDEVVFPKTTAGTAVLTATVTLENAGCGSLSLLSALAKRKDTRGRIEPEDDSEHFMVAGLGIEPDDRSIVFSPGQRRDLEVAFNPGIPRVISQSEERQSGGLPAGQVLPQKVHDVLTFSHTAGTSTVRLFARVKPVIRLIHPIDTQLSPPVALGLSGDSFRVSFSIYDSNLNDVDHALIEFFDQDDAKGGEVPVDNKVVELRATIKTRNLAQGQSFTVIQEFTNAIEHPETRSVRVTVFGGESQDQASGNLSATAAEGNEVLRRRVLSRRAPKLPRSGSLRRAATQLKDVE